MKRRSFLKAAAAAIAAPLVPSFLIAEVRRLPIDLTKFCEEEAHRYDLTRPFLQGDHTYATDGRIMVRIGDVAAAVDDEERRLPRVGGLPWNHAARDRWQRFPQEKLIRISERSEWCFVCRGKGRIGECVSICGDCHEGYVSDDEDVKSCQRCKRSGYVGGIECEYCEGKGLTTRPDVQQVGEVFVSAHYARLVRDLPNAEFFVEATPIYPSGVVMFRAHGAEGLLMPVVKL